jgi:ferritin-like protein
MANSSAELHEGAEVLRPATLERHRAIVSIMEELEAVDWYDQRVDATQDDELRAILEHNRDEEKEHAAMALEWLRRHDPVLDHYLRAYLFTQGPIAAREAAVKDVDGAGASDGSPASGHSLGIGDLRGGRN